MNRFLPENIIGSAIIPAPEKGHSPYDDLPALRNAVREALINAGLASEDENPFGAIVKPGASVLLKPNWVLHYNKGGHGMDCMITHPSFIEAVILELIKAKPAKIIIADAPIQTTVFSEIVTTEIAERFKKAAGATPLEIRDLRSTICLSQTLQLQTVQNPAREGQGVLFDLGGESLIEPLSKNSDGHLRNTSYDPRELSRTHSAGRHQYVLCREVFDCDVIISLPKLKSHRKSGITGALKNVVGVNGNKDYLPHHRIGGSDEGGDCYEGHSLLKRWAEYFLDHANQHINSRWYGPWRLGVNILLKFNKLIWRENELEGSWFGNDTVWRMVLDLNRIILYGTSDGNMSNDAQRKVYSLTDAIIIGEGFGPLAPKPRYLGFVTFASCSASAELIHSALLRFNPEKIPLVTHAFDKFTYPLTDISSENVRMRQGGIEYTVAEASRKFAINCEPAPGWKNHIEMEE
jgi:uncharacterized protein (DUF362 family)